MAHVTVGVISGVLLASIIIGCGKDNETAAQQQTEITEAPAPGDVETTATGASQWNETSELQVSEDRIGKNSVADVASADADADADAIPYPLYPNSSKYRVGGENGLKVVLFQTEDSFEQVDTFYQSQANLPRLSAMNDYVRYSIDEKDQDPWATTKPGIVIHQFNTAGERDAVGADASANTNIIMSFH